MPNKRDQDARNRIRLVVNRGEVDKQSIQPTCHVAAPKPGNLLIRTLGTGYRRPAAKEKLLEHFPQA